MYCNIYYASIKWQTMYKKNKKTKPRWIKRPIKKHRWLIWLGRLSLSALALVLLTGIMLFAWISRDLPTPDGIVQRTVSQSTKIYDRTGQVVLYDIHGAERRTNVELKDIPDFLKQATITAEDRYFYQHHGFRFTSMVRALLVDLVSGSLAQGGSTITQQFIKNAILTNEKSYLRKIKELVLAYQMEQRFSKDQILKLYLNEIPYGSTAYGVEAASEMVFGKNVKELTLAEAALLAALPQSPSYYSPWGSHVDDLINRQHYILDSMVEQGYINKNQAEQAKQVNITAEFKPHHESIVAPHFVFYVKDQLSAIYGEKMVEQGGLKIITTLDVNKQKMAEQAINNGVPKIEQYKANNASLVALDSATNQILALVGSRDYFNNDIQGQVNVAIRPRQPGSSFKPIVYVTAFNEGFTPDTLLYDVKTDFKTDTATPYSPNDYDGKERGPISLRKALAGSLNIPAVKLLYLSKIDNVLDLANKLGYTTLKNRSRFGLSLVLGGAEVSLLEHTAAYAALSREGVAKPLIGILRVEDSSGNVLQEFKDTPGERVVSTQAVRLLSNVLSDNDARSYIFGASNHLTLPDRPVAAKTGTTNDYHDAWTMGYTPDLTVGVWVGNNNNKAMARGADGSVVAAPIWQNFFRQATANTPVKNFIPPEPTPPTNKPLLNGQLPGEQVVIDTNSGNLATELTPDTYKKTVTYTENHTILKYVTPGDPLGPLPADPNQDPQYQNWENAITDWVKRNNIPNTPPPTTYDFLHSLDNQPSLSILSPVDSQTITSLPFTILLNTSAPRGIKKVTYQLDDIGLGVSTSAPFSFSPTSLPFVQGQHILTVSAYDDIDNKKSASVLLNLKLDNNYLSNQSIILAPPANSQLVLNNSPITLTISNSQPAKIKQIDAYASLAHQPAQWFGVIAFPADKNYLTWQPNQPGDYSVYLIVTDTTNQTIQGPPIAYQITQ